jgi:hypothetical protein
MASRSIGSPRTHCRATVRAMSASRHRDPTPPWVGLFALLLGAAFVGVGVLIARDDGGQGTLLFGLVSAGLGVMALGMGAYVLGLRLPLGRLMRSRPREVVDADGSLWTAFRRPPGARLWNVLGPLFGVAFSLVFVALGLMSGDPEAWPFVLLGGLFLVIMVFGTVRGLRGLVRAEDTLRVGARGLWLPSVGVIPWADIDSIAIDDFAARQAAAHGESLPMNQVFRLAVRLRPGASLHADSAVDRAMLGIAALAPGGAELTVFGYELGVPAEEAMARIERQRP